MRPISSGSSFRSSGSSFRHTGSSGSASRASGSASGSASRKSGSASGSASRGTGSASGSTLSQTARVTSHQTRQLNRIQKGMNDGTLTSEEANGLAQKQAEIAKAESAALADGKLDKKEFKELRKMQKEASRDIFEKRHNSAEQPCPAGERASRLEGFQSNQSSRIQAGVGDGSLSAGEAGKMMDLQKRIAETKGGAMADGTIDENEYNQLRQLQREASIAIFNARHNGGIAA